MHTRVLAALLLIAPIPAGAARAAVLAPELPTSAVAYLSPVGGSDFLRVRGICLLPNGDLAVVDEQAQKVVVMSPRGLLRFSFGTVGTAPGQFRNPAAVAATAGGDMLVADRDNSRLQRFDSAGSLLQVIGSPGTGPGQFQRPSGVAAAPNGHIFVCDQESHRIVHLAPDGTFIAQWGSLGTAIGQFQYPSQVAVDRHGDVYVTDLYNDRVQKFTANGTFIRAWGTTGSGNGQFNFPAGIAIDELENVFVGETGGSHRIQRFSSRGEWLGTIDGAAIGPPALSNAPTAMVTNGRGQLYVVDYILRVVQRFDYMPQPPPIGVLGAVAASSFPPSDAFWFPAQVAADDLGGAYLMDSRLIVYRLTSHGEVLNSWHASPDGAYEAFRPTSGIAFHDGRVYVTDPIHGRVRVFERDGTFVEAWGSFPPTVPGGTWYLSGIQIDTAGLVSLESSGQVARFHLNGDAVDSYGLPAGFFYYDGRLEVTPSGDGWVPTAQGKILHLSQQGALVGQFPSLIASNGDGLSLFYSPGRGLYDLDRDQNLLRLFDDSGALLGTQVLGSPGVLGAWSMDGDASGSYWITEMQARIARRYEVAPVLESVDDVPADAGGTVAIRFLKSSADAVTSASPITQYQVFRKLDGVIPPDANPSPELPGWELVQTIPATRTAEYSFTSTTRSDATPAGRYLTTFLVRARLAIGSTLDSRPIAGYSHDEIAPDPPTEVSVAESAGNSTLHWRPGALAGTRYRVHRDASPAFEVHEGNAIAETSDTTFSDPGVTGATYAIEAMDDAQNLSAPVRVSALGVLGVPPAPAGASFALRRLVPNPSNGARIGVDLSLAGPEPARLEVFDTSGRRVHDQKLAGLGAGPHSLEIQPARRLAAGVYVVRLSTPRQSREMRMLVVR